MMKITGAAKCPYTDSSVERAFGEEVNLFMHCHMRGYDKEGEGKQLHSEYYDKYGAPIDVLDSWLEGYHVIEKLLAKYFKLCDTGIMDFPLVAGVAGGVHLYKPLHSDKPWNWTGWVPLQRKWLVQGKFFSNRYFLSIRGNEIQNNLWDYHPHELELDDEVTDEMESSQFQPTDQYRGGFYFEGNPFGRYLHVMTIKEHKVDSYLGGARRYNYIVHPLAYRSSLNNIPDNGVDAMQWCIINIEKEKNFGAYTNFGKCHALEIFNDFTYSNSYSPESSDTCYNGTLIPGEGYIYWFNTYPLEYAEFLLDSALTRGVYLHTLTSNDAFFKKVCEFDPARDPHAEEKLRKYTCDPKGGLQVSHLKRCKGAQRKTVKTRTEKRLTDEHSNSDQLEMVKEFLSGRPYGFETVFAYTTLIDTERRIRNAIYQRSAPGSGIDEAEVHALDYLLSGNFYASLGINNVFEYTASQAVPFLIKNQPNPARMCHVIDEKNGMDLVFTFAKCKNKPSRSRLIWRYTIMSETEDNTGLETAHGYFKLQTKGVTILNLSNAYEIKRVKWLYFVVIDPVNPMRRAWFNAIKGPAFGMPILRNPEEELESTVAEVTDGGLGGWFGKERLADIGSKLFQAGGNLLAGKTADNQLCDLPDLKHRVFYTRSSNRGRVIVQDEEFHPEQLPSDDLEFTFPKCPGGNEDICVYFLQVCPHVQDITIPNKTEKSSKERPPRILQSVHGFYLMHSEYPTKLKLSNSWDKNTVKDGTVYVYDISASTGQPLNPSYQ